MRMRSPNRAVGRALSRASDRAALVRLRGPRSVEHNAAHPSFLVARLFSEPRADAEPRDPGVPALSVPETNTRRIWSTIGADHDWLQLI
jgi:hypothetical protein